MPPRKKKAYTRLWLILPAVVFVSAIIIGLASKGQTQQSTPPTHAAQQPTTQPSAKITSPVSIQSKVQSIVQKSGTSYVGGAAVTYNATAKYAHVFENIQVTGNHNVDFSRIKHDAFAIQKAIWQAHLSGLDSLQIIFNSDGANRIATCELERTTAAKLNWDNISRDQAWSDYDSTWLSKSL
jgi:hypothetical protein